MKKRDRKILFLIALLTIIITVIGISIIYFYKRKTINSTQGKIENSLFATDTQIVHQINDYEVIFNIESYNSSDANIRVNEDIRGRLHIPFLAIEHNNFRAELEVHRIKIYHENGQILFESVGSGSHDIEFLIPENGYYFCDMDYTIFVYDKIEECKYYDR